jgi:serine/threonine-protein kinase
MDEVTQQPGSASVTAPEGAHPASPEPDLTGTTLGDFHVLRRLGQGGMGQVYLAEQVSLKRKVALKLLRADLAANTTSLHRFKAEAEAVARATHANIVQVYFSGESSGLHYMALEYVEGRNLREYLEKKGSPTIMVALGIKTQVAAALQRASELGIIHRDIKPENILLTRSGEVKVADFGLSRCFDENTQPLNLTQSGVTMGTPLYMSPEQVEGKPVDPRSDIYSFGITCYQMFAGQPPFTGQSPFEVALQHVNKEPQPLAEVRPDLPPELCAVVHKMVAKKPEERFQTGREVVRELNRVRNLLLGLSPDNSGFSLGTAPAEPLDSMPTMAIPSVRRSWLVPWAALTIILALVGGLAFGWLRNSTGDPSLPPEQPGDDPGPVKTLLSKKEQEKDLLRRWQQTKPEIMWRPSGLEIATDLGLFYINEKQWQKAETFFKELESLGPAKKKPEYRHLGLLGQGTLLAFQDRAEESNNKFLAVLSPGARTDKGNPKLEKMARGFWINNPQICEMIARALNHNFANAPDTFPPALERWRHPPEPRGASTKS